jgi:uncharacterized protein (TIGR02145 family)
VNYTFQFLISPYPPGTVHCNPANPTAIVDVYPYGLTGNVWMDRNLGATQVATSSTDSLAYGDLYQWGRFADGHQCRTSPTTNTLSSSDIPGHGYFILENGYGTIDWRNPQNNNLWQGVNGVNNPCPTGYRLPTQAEWHSLIYSICNAAGAFASPLKLTLAGYRLHQDGSLYMVGGRGSYWTSTIGSASYGNTAYRLHFDYNSSHIDQYGRAYGRSVRCIKD